MEKIFFNSWFDLLRVLIVAVLAYASLVGFLRVSGKRTLSKMNAFDLVVTVALGSTLATILLSKDVALAEGLLALAVLIGVVISALVFAWENAKRIRARKYVDEQGVKHYELYGPLFFGSVTAFNEKFDVPNDPDRVVIDFRESRVADMSGIEALNKLTERYHKAGKKLHLKHLSPDCRKLLANAAAVIEVNYWEDPQYQVLTNA